MTIEPSAGLFIGTLSAIVALITIFGAFYRISKYLAGIAQLRKEMDWLTHLVLRYRHTNTYYVGRLTGRVNMLSPNHMPLDMPPPAEQDDPPKPTPD